MVFCNKNTQSLMNILLQVTILILIDGFLQYWILMILLIMVLSHNPYFNRWFSAIPLSRTNIPINQSHNPYFNRWFSAIQKNIKVKLFVYGHNPYFNRWFSAMYQQEKYNKEDKMSQSLF